MSAIYKVIITSKQGVTHYKTNNTVLCQIKNGSSGYELISENQSISFSSFKDADKDARERIARLFASLGIVPQFIEELEDSAKTSDMPNTTESPNLVKLAYEICATAHAGQTDKVGMPYHLHPERVAARCSTDAETIVALLHDTIEDTDITPEYLLSKGFPQYIVDGVLSVTKREGESYEDFVARAKQNPIGRMVKIHDLEDNMDLRRLDELTDEMVARQRKYLKAYHFLKQD